MRKVAATLVFLSLISCSSVNELFFTINPGDSKESVIGKMGPPDDRQFKGKNEAFQYCTTGTSFGQSTFNVIWFFDGKVTGANTYTVSHAASCMGHFKQINWEDAPDITFEVRER